MKPLFKLGKKYHGHGPVNFSWHHDGSFLASAGNNGLVHIFDRHGEDLDEIALSSKAPVIALEWSPDGETLAVLQENNGVVSMWSVGNRSTFNLETNATDPTFMQWSKSGKCLVVGTSKGNLFMYSPTTRKKTPILGKHPKEISCGDWSSNDLLALGSIDGTFTLSKLDGSTVQQSALKQAAISMSFGYGKSGQNSKSRTNEPENVILINISKSIILYDLNDRENPIELSFQSRYGKIVHACWFGDGQVVMAFSTGFLIVASTHPDELGEEQFSGKFYKERIIAMAYSKELNRVALCGDGGIKIVNMTDFSEIKEDCISLVDAEENEANLMKYTSDAQILTVATLGGIVQNFLSRMPNIYDHHKTSVAYLSSLREVSVVDMANKGNTVSVKVEIEPSFISLGPAHVAVGMNNRVWYYSYGKDDEDVLVNEQEYLGSVTCVRLNKEFSAVLCEGKVTVHTIERGGQGSHESIVFPEKMGDGSVIKSVSLVMDFLIYGTQSGNLEYFYLKDWATLNGSSFRHMESIVDIFPNPQGTRAIFLDSRRQAFLYNPISSTSIHIPEISTSVTKILWDPLDKGFFIAVELDQFCSYMYSPITLNGEQIFSLGPMTIESNGDILVTPKGTRIPVNHSCILISDGRVTCQEPGGALKSVLSDTHSKLNSSYSTTEKAKTAFRQNLTLLRFQDAWKLATSIDTRDYWLALAGKALELLEVGIATRAYRKLGDAGMVIALEELLQIEDKNLLAGQILILFCDYSRAQELLLTSSFPEAALRMRRDLLQWDQALRLAGTLAPEQIPELSSSYAQQLEFMGDHAQSLKMYEQAYEYLRTHEQNCQESDRIKTQCAAGIARSSLRLGDIRRGTKLVEESDNPDLCKECGQILEAAKQLQEAAVLYECGRHYERAAGIYIQCKNLDKAAALMKHVTATKLHGLYARSKEAVGDFQSAVSSYEVAQDLDSVVRIYLTKLKNPEKAFAVVRYSKSSEGALAVAKHCISAGNYGGAIEFLLLAKKIDEGFELAQSHHEMSMFTQILGDTISVEYATKVAQYYENNQNPGKAGEYYKICGNYHKSLKLFLSCGEKELEQAIEVVGKARNDMLTHTLIDYLMGETDGVPKDPNYIFRLYMALGNFQQAAKTANIVARQEQDIGNYKVAHEVLLEISRKLKQNEVAVPQALQHSLMLLHSYQIAKQMAKSGDHTAAARMLIRVANNVSKFPAHVINILTSTVIECQRGNLKPLAYEFAVKLMSPENRSLIEDKFKRKIEAIVRRPCKETQEPTVSPCPYCDEPVALTELDCPKCKTWIPYCIITGNHMEASNWSQCPTCDFPALYSQFISHIDAHKVCPMCAETVNKDHIVLATKSQIGASSKG